MPSKPWQETVQQKRDIQAKLLEPYRNLGSGENSTDIGVLNIKDVAELTTLFAQGTLRVHDVVQRYIRRYEDHADRASTELHCQFRTDL